jgi:hypothetical protein
VQFSPVEPALPSSQVMKMAVSPALYTFVAVSNGSHFLSQLSPARMTWLSHPVAPCMSSQRLGVTNANAGAVFSAAKAFSSGK